MRHKQYILSWNIFRNIKLNKMYKISIIIFQKIFSASGVTIETYILCVANKSI